MITEPGGKQEVFGGCTYIIRRCEVGDIRIPFEKLVWIMTVWQK